MIPKYFCDYCEPGCIAHGLTPPKACPYDYDSNEFKWQLDKSVQEHRVQADAVGHADWCPGGHTTETGNGTKCLTCQRRLT